MFYGSEYDLINEIFFNYFPLRRTRISEYFPKNQRITGIMDLIVDGISDVIEKGFKTGVAVSFGGLFGSLCESGQKG